MSGPQAEVETAAGASPVSPAYSSSNMSRTVDFTSASGTKTASSAERSLISASPVAECARADRDADRVADQIGVVELDAGALGAIVVEHFDRRPSSARRRAGRPRPAARCRQPPPIHNSDTSIRSDRHRPDDPLIVMLLLDHRRRDAPGTDAIRTHEDRMADPLRIQIRRRRAPWNSACPA